MKHSELIKFVNKSLKEGLKALNVELPVIQKNQPTQQGTEAEGQNEDNDAVYFEHLYDEPRGWVKTDYDLKIDPDNPDDDYFKETDTQLVQTPIQITVMVTQDPERQDKVSAQDVANGLRLYLSSRYFMYTLREAGGMNILRIPEVRNPKFVNDRNMYQAYPNFDITFTHKRSIGFDIGLARVFEEGFVKVI